MAAVWWTLWRYTLYILSNSSEDTLACAMSGMLFMPRSSTILSLMSSSMCWNILWAWRGVAWTEERPEIRNKTRIMADRTRTRTYSENNKRVTRDKTGDRKDIEDTAG